MIERSLSVTLSFDWTGRAHLQPSTLISTRGQSGDAARKQGDDGLRTAVHLDDSISPLNTPLLDLRLQEGEKTLRPTASELTSGDRSPALFRIMSDRMTLRLVR